MMRKAEIKIKQMIATRFAIVLAVWSTEKTPQVRVLATYALLISIGYKTLWSGISPTKDEPKQNAIEIFFLYFLFIPFLLASSAMFSRW